jgi:hypothetical protein
MSVARELNVPCSSSLNVSSRFSLSFSLWRKSQRLMPSSEFFFVAPSTRAKGSRCRLMTAPSSQIACLVAVAEAAG